MLIILSPAKTLDFETIVPAPSTHPQSLDRTAKLIQRLKELGPAELGGLMKLSDKLTELNFQRYRDFAHTPSPKGAKQALLAFKGDVYRDWPLDEYSEDDFAHAQAHLRILSGLYGLLRPLDLIQPYRLEMGTKLETRRGKDLYAFWGEHITTQLGDAIAAQGDRRLINLASNEYFKAIKPKSLDAEIISPVFKDAKGNGDHKIIAFYAKRARGAMAHYLLKARINDLEGLQAFNLGGYRHDPATSTPRRPVFLRRH